MTTLAISFTNFGPYHLARLRALARRLGEAGGRLVAYETAAVEKRYPWRPDRQAEPFGWVTLFPDRDLESIPGPSCRAAIASALDRDRPDALAICGYARPESMAALAWANRRARPAILMSESGRIDHPRTWWKEAVKRRRVRRFSSAIVGGPRHRDYLASLGMPPQRIALGYNAVDNALYARLADEARRSPEGRSGLPESPYFLAVNRFVPEKNLIALVWAFADYRRSAPGRDAWDLVLCGDGPSAPEVDAAIRASGMGHAIHRPGFLQADGLARWYAFASAFVHPSRMEPWGLVVNEAAACGLPLIVSDRSGCVETLVKEGPEGTGYRFDPLDVDALAASLARMAALPESERVAMGRRAASVVADWGPDRFAEGMVEAIAIGSRPVRARKRVAT